MREVTLAPGLSVRSPGLGGSSLSRGCSHANGAYDDPVGLIERAVELGVNLFDTADVYGPFTSECAIGQAMQGRHRKELVIATKCGLVTRPDGTLARNGRRGHVRAACDASLRRLQTDWIDLYQLHRIDPEVPLSETWGALGELVTEGKVRALGISHATVAELRELQTIFPISAVQYELSVWERRSTRDVLPWCRRNGVGFVAFSPIGRGFLSGTVTHADLSSNDSRLRDPRFSTAATLANRKIVDGLEKVSRRYDGVTPSQVALAWVMAQGDDIVPIPGTRRRRWLEENVAAADLRLTSVDLQLLDDLPVAVGEMHWDAARSNGVDA